MSRNPISFSNILQLGLTLDRRVQRALQIGFDALAIFISLLAAMFLRLETTSFLDQISFFISYLLILLPTLYIFARMGLYRAFMRYVSTEIAVLVALGSCVSAVFVIVAKLVLAPFIPWSTPIIFGALLFITVTGLRFTLRTMFRSNLKKHRKYIAIYGAGAAGAELLQSLASSSDYRVQMILDDNPLLQGKRLYGLHVMSFEEATNNFQTLDIDIMLLAMPSANFAERQKIISRVNNYALQVKTIPAVVSLIDGSAQITEFRDIAIEDLLGRERVNPLPHLMNNDIYGKTVLITGAGGSIGSELCLQIVELKPKKLILLDVSELAIYKITADLEQQVKHNSVILVSLVGAVQDQPLVATILKQYKVDTIFHAAAYKHVHLMEKNVIQAIKNNTIGTMILAEEAVRNKVTNFTLISTDKAVNPTNIMGASKRLAERICLAMDTEQSVTCFSMVRFGNVLGSSGSVVPLFQKQIAAGGPITLTHPEVMRYFMTVGEAVQLVIQASSMAKGSEVFVLDMGVPVKIKDLAFKMIQLSGLRPYLETDSLKDEGDIAVSITGLRPGEKMYEELTYGKNLKGSAHPRIMTVNEVAMKKQDMHLLTNKLEVLIANQDHEGLVNQLIEAADYTPDIKYLSKTSQVLSVNNIKNQDNKIIKMPANKK